MSTDVFLSANGDVRLGDFGLCKLIPCSRINMIPREDGRAQPPKPAGGAKKGRRSQELPEFKDGLEHAATPQRTRQLPKDLSDGDGAPSSAPSSTSSTPTMPRRESNARPNANAVGTPLYMSPEHLGGRPFDTHADVWAFACTIFEAMGLVRAPSQGPFPEH